MAWIAVTTLLLLVALSLLWLTPAEDIGQLLDDLVASYCIAWAITAFLSKRPVDEVRKQFVTMTMALAVLGGVLETAALAGFVDYRLIFRVVPNKFDLLRDPHQLLDDELFHKRRPHEQYEVSDRYGDLGAYLCHPPQHVDRYDVKYDRLGFRNDDLPEHADIVVVGDSFIEGTGVPSHALLTSVLGRLQQRSVVNLGESFYGPQQELLVLKRYGLPFRPRIVIWAIYEGNDLQDIERYERTRAEWEKVKRAVQRPWERSFMRNLLLTVLPLRQRCTPFPSYIHSGLFYDRQGNPYRMYFPYSQHSTKLRRNRGIGQVESNY